AGRSRGNSVALRIPWGTGHGDSKGEDALLGSTVGDARCATNRLGGSAVPGAGCLVAAGARQPGGVDHHDGHGPVSLPHLSKRNRENNRPVLRPPCRTGFDDLVSRRATGEFASRGPAARPLLLSLP